MKRTLVDWALAGSSPLTRGKPFLGLLGDRDGGLIPAHAGKTVPCVAATCHLRAHPRSRGENSRTTRRAICQRGSSPLTRGKRPRAKRTRSVSGLIPAHAGKTRWRGHRLPWSAAHPRSRGENARTDPARTPKPGSSPLTRGKRRGRGHGSRRSGLIPAHAGKTRFLALSGGDGRAHPRSRGENSWSTISSGTEIGSSPLTRGKRESPVLDELAAGLIPAHAGKTSTSSSLP